MAIPYLASFELLSTGIQCMITESPTVQGTQKTESADLPLLFSLPLIPLNLRRQAQGLLQELGRVRGAETSISALRGPNGDNMSETRGKKQLCLGPFPRALAISALRARVCFMI